MRAALYSRVSTQDQDPDGQARRLREWAECEGHEVVIARSERASGRDNNRPLQDEVMRYAMLRRAQVVAVTKVDRWARSVQHFASSIARLHDRGITFVAIDQALTVAPRDPAAKLYLNMLSAIAEFEASLISERTREGLAEAQRNGTRLGRPMVPCAICGGERRETGHLCRFHGSRVSICAACKRASREEREERWVAKKGGAPE